MIKKYMNILKEKQNSIKIALEKQSDYGPLIEELRERLEKIDKELKEDE